MDRIAPYLVIVAIIAVFVSRFFRSPRRPPSPVFTCGRCRKVSHHDRRTTDAWRAGKTRFFCRACHRAWLATRPHRPADRPMPREQASGCLGAILWLLLLPAGAVIAWTMR